MGDFYLCDFQKRTRRISYCFLLLWRRVIHRYFDPEKRASMTQLSSAATNTVSPNGISNLRTQSQIQRQREERRWGTCCKIKIHL